MSQDTQFGGSSNGLNEHWMVVAAGVRELTNTPEQLWEAAISYFKWCDEHPIQAKKTVQSGKSAGDKVEVEFKRPYSIKGFCLHANISERYISDIKNSYVHTSEWYIIMEKILMIIYNQNLEGAIVDIYNPIIVSKILNLDKGSEDAPAPVREEIIDSEKSKLANSENDILEKLDFGKVEILQSKLEKP